MNDRFLPRRIDNTYRGQRAALWLFGLVVAVKMLQGVMVVFNGYSIARSADGIPLETFPPAAAQESSPSRPTPLPRMERVGVRVGVRATAADENPSPFGRGRPQAG